MSRFLRLLGIVSSVSLVVGLAAPALALPRPASGLVSTGLVSTELVSTGLAEDDPDPLPAQLDELVNPGDTVPGAAPTSDPLPPQDDPVASPVPPVFPEADVAELEVTEPPPDGDQRRGKGDSDGVAAGSPFPLSVWTPPDGGEDRVLGLAPGSEGPAQDGVGAADDDDLSVPASVTAAVLGADQVQALGGLGLAFTLTRSDGIETPGAVTVDAVYDSFRFAAGGSLVSRLRLVSMPGCALTAPTEPGCQTRTPVDASNDTEQGLLRGVVTADGDTGAGKSRIGADDASGPTVFVVVSDSASSSGNYAAFPITPTESWAVGIGSGDFTWSEPLPTVPLPRGGVSGAPALSYSSASVDGRTTAKNPQASWAGIGWDLSAASITQAFQSCEQAGQSEHGADSCFYTGAERYLLNLNGHSSPLVPLTGSTTHFYMRDDPGWQIFRLTPSGKDAWQVITPDGTVYLFGWADGTNSIWRMPVNNAPSSGYTDAPWQWSLTNAYDTSGNMVAYYYTKQTNYFKTHDLTSNSIYDRGGFLQHIEYGRTSDGIDTEQPATGELTFATANRCGGSGCDVPTDLVCSATGSCAQDSPTFFVDQRLASITSAVKLTTWQGVDVMTLTHQMLDTASDTGSQLWLSSVKTAPVSDPEGLALPATLFTHALLDNRLDAIHARMFRINGVTLPTGGTLAITYGMPDPCTTTGQPADLPVGGGRGVNRDCFVAWGTRDSGTPPDSGFVWFAKWVLTQTVKSAGVGDAGDGVVETTNYTYLDPDGCVDTDNPNDDLNPCGPEVHHDDTAYVDEMVRGWGVWRGYAKVEVDGGSTTGHITKDVYKLLRGMSGDEGTNTVVYPPHARYVTDYHGHTIEDLYWYRDFVYEHDQYADATQLSAATNTPAIFGRDTAADDTSDIETSQFVVDDTDIATTVVPGGTNRKTETDNSYDPTTGMPTQAWEKGDVTIGTDDRCATTSYWPTDEATWILVPHEQVVHTGSCSGTQAAKTDTLYDLVAGKPTTGLPTEVDAFWGTGSGDHTTTQMSYDSYGRVTSVTVANSPDQVRTTSYSPTTGVPSTVTVSNDYWTESTTTYTSDRHLPSTVTDANSHTTTLSYDALGRLSKVWEPTEATTGPASLIYTYSITQTGPPLVTSRTLQNFVTAGSTTTGNYLDSFAFLDGWGRARQTQVVAPTGAGRIVTATRYDDRGLVAAQTGPMYMTDTPGSGMVNPVLADIPSETRTTYDALGRVVDSRLYNNGTPMLEDHVSTAYFGTYSTVDPAGSQPVTTSVDAFGRTSKVDPVSTTSATYTYDALDNLKTITDGAGNVTSYTYDQLSRRTDTDDPDTGHWHFTYDAAGNQVTTKDAENQTTWTKFDKLNRKTELRDTGPGGTLLDSWTYDTGGRKGLLVSSTSVVDTASYTTSNMTYDARNRLTGKTYDIPAAAGGALSGTYTFAYTYDAADHRITTSYPDKGGLDPETVTTHYSNRGYEASLENVSGSTYIASTTYENYGALAERDFGGGNNLVRSYDYEPGTRWLASLTTTFNGGTVQDSGYGYGYAGSLLSIVTADTGTPNECFGYDNADQLTSAFTSSGSACGGTHGTGHDGYDQTFQYSNEGNLVTRDAGIGVPGSFLGYTYPGPGQAHPHAPLTQIYSGGEEPPGGYPTIAAYTYDANGQRRTAAVDITGDEIDTDYHWNTQHQLTATTVDEGTTSVTGTYTYDADGNRLIRNDGTTKTLYLDNTEINTGSTPSVRYYTTGNGTIVGLRQGSGAWTRVLLNHQGSAQYLIKNGTTNVKNVEYQPYGETRTSTAGLSTDRRFLHAPNDDQTGLIQLGARYYDPALTGFITADPLLDTANPETLNPYRYALNNPETYQDPTGLAAFCGEAQCGPAGVPEQLKEQCRACGYTGTCARACEAFQVVVSVTNPEVYLIGGWLDYKNGNGSRFTAIGASIPFGGALRLAGKLPILEKLGGSLGSTIHGISGDAAKSSTGLLDDAGRIESHLARLDHSPANDAMLARIRGAAADGRPLTEAEQNFVTHELTEAGLMDRGMGYPEAHELAGQTHPTFGNYDPEVIKQFPEHFNQNWRNYWGIE